jgi:AraC-like DNA-binding protein
MTGAKEIQELGIDPLLKDSFSVEGLKERRFAAEQPYRPDHNQVLFVKEGAGTLLIDGISIPFAANNLLLISKNQVYQFGKNVVTGYLLQFGDCFWERTPASANNCKAVLFDNGMIERRFSLDTASQQALDHLFDTTLKEFTGPDYANKPDVLAAYLKIIIIKIANIYALLQEDTGSYDNKLYQDFITLVREEYSQVHDVASFARRLGVSSRKLSEISRRFGNGAKEVINGQLIAEAKRLLQFSSQPIKEIAGNLHFATPYQFSNFFKKYTSLSPLEYRRQFVKIGI